tara:strand:+ start:717 stop:1223 length:507 start_codon:yes stop_codon:yes gene_type:complete
MRKINILKAIVDFLWIVTIPIGALLIIIFIPAVFFIDFGSTDIKVFDIYLKNDTIYTKIILAILAANSLLLFYSFHLFRNVLRYFQRVKIFESEVTHLFSKIGTLLVISGTVSLILGFITPLYFENNLSLTIGLNSNLIVIGLGLFFQILSEAFKIAKKAKQENDSII